MKKPETIYLEQCLAHCNIANSIAYHFTGTMNLPYFQKSVQDVLSRVDKFQYELTGTDEGNITWKEMKRPVPPVKLLHTRNFDESFGEFTASIFDLCSEYRYFPLFFTVFSESADNGSGATDEKPVTVTGKFYLVQTLNHAYCDGRSCEFLLNMITEYYNALTENNVQAQTGILKTVSDASTVSSDRVYSFGRSDSLIKISPWQQLKNLFRLITMKLSDSGGFSVKYPVIESEWENFRRQKHYPQMHYFDLNPLVRHYQQKNSSVNINSLITALLVKAFYHVNGSMNGHPEKKMISFRMMSDILSARHRQKLIGNYCAYAPLITDGSKSLMDVAEDIVKQVEIFRKNKLDVTMYKFLEFALRNRMAGKKDDPTSFTVSLVLHRKFMKHPKFLKGTTFIRTTGALNYSPLDVLGAKLNNKVGPTLSISDDNVLFVTYYPLIGGDQTLNKVTEALKTVLKNEISLINSPY